MSHMEQRECPRRLAKISKRGKCHTTRLTEGKDEEASWRDEMIKNQTSLCTQMERVRKPKQPDEKRSRESQGDGADRKKNILIRTMITHLKIKYCSLQEIFANFISFDLKYSYEWVRITQKRYWGSNNLNDLTEAWDSKKNTGQEGKLRFWYMFMWHFVSFNPFIPHL